MLACVLACWLACPASHTPAPSTIAHGCPCPPLPAPACPPLPAPACLQIRHTSSEDREAKQAVSLIQIELEAKQRRAAAMHEEVLALQGQLREAEAQAQVGGLAGWQGGWAGERLAGLRWLCCFCH